MTSHATPALLRLGCNHIFGLTSRRLTEFPCAYETRYSSIGGSGESACRLHLHLGHSYTFGLSAAVGFFLAWLVTFTAPYFINPSALNWGPRYGYIWVPACVICLIWVFFFLPETKGRTLEQIDEMFMLKLPARKFRGHECVGLAQLGVEQKVAEGDNWDAEKSAVNAQQTEIPPSEASKEEK